MKNLVGGDFCCIIMPWPRTLVSYCKVVCLDNECAFTNTQSPKGMCSYILIT